MKTIWLKEHGWGSSLRTWLDTVSRHGRSVIRHLTFWRVVNTAVVLYEMALRRHKVCGKPLVIKIEPTNFCNFHCPGCWTGTGEYPGPKGTLEFDSFRKMLDPVAWHAYKLILYMWGEPFINKNIFRMIEYATGKNMAVQISTNMNVFRPEIDAPRLVASGLEHMIVALDGVSQEVYETYRVGGRVDKVIQNVEAIVAEKRRQGKKFPFIELQYIVFPHNRHEMDQVRELAVKLGVDRLTFIESKTREQAMVKNGKPVEPDKCNSLWMMACFNWDGSLSPCCDSVDDSFGNVLEQDLGTLWNSDKIMKSRSLFTARPIVGGPATKCTRCRIYHGYVTFLPEPGGTAPPTVPPERVPVDLVPLTMPAAAGVPKSATLGGIGGDRPLTPIGGSPDSPLAAALVADDEAQRS
jgi:MoaA/NifB/PqqE/SkfB family radical SAM enzyme